MKKKLFALMLCIALTSGCVYAESAVGAESAVSTESTVSTESNSDTESTESTESTEIFSVILIIFRFFRYKNLCANHHENYFYLSLN